MIHEEENGHRVPERPGFHVYVEFWTVEHPTRPPVHRAPDHRRCGGIGAPRRVEPQGTAEGVRSVRARPSNGRPVPCSRPHFHLGVDPGLESSSVAPHLQAGRSPERVHRLSESQVSRQDESRPSLGNLARGNAVERVEVAHVGRKHVGRSAHPGSGGNRERCHQHNHQEDHSRP